MKHVYKVGTFLKYMFWLEVLRCVFLRIRASLRRMEGCVIRKQCYNHNKASDGTLEQGA